jgi:diguanylate cyclase
VVSAESSEKTHRFATETLSLLNRHGIPETPPNYEIFFNYVAGTNPDLDNAIDEILRGGGEFTPEQLDSLQLRFLASRAEAETVSRTNLSLQSAIETVMAVMTQMGGDTSRFGETIRVLADQLSARDGEAHVKSVLSKIVGETNAMTARTHQLESSLEAASTEISALRQHLESVRREAITDALTGLGNRKCFNDELRLAIDHSLQDGDPLCVVIGDVDHFKKFNDTWGHQLGDQVLKLVAFYFKANVKGQDTATRYGGEEFAIILPKTRLSNAVLVADHIRRAVCAKKMKKRTTGETIGYVTISMGVAQYRPGEPHADFIARADEALYAAKHNGRNRVVSEANDEASGHLDGYEGAVPLEVRA